jgi:hypothetical protein
MLAGVVEVHGFGALRHQTNQAFIHCQRDVAAIAILVVCVATLFILGVLS